MHNFIIRNAGDADINQVSELARTIWEQHYIDIITKEQIEYMLDKMYSAESLKEQVKKAYLFLLAEDEGSIIGYLSLYKKGAGDFFLDKLYVDTSRQKKNVGNSLLQEAIKHCTGNLRLQVNRKNFKAINFYFKEGFKIEKVEDFDIGNNFQMNDFVMLKKL